MAIAAFGALLGLVVATGRPAFDQSVLRFLARHREHVVTGFMRAVSDVGAWPGLLVTVVVVGGLVAWRLRVYRVLVVPLLALAGSEATELVVKAGVGRHRPPKVYAVQALHPHGFSFPSGHATTSSATYGALALVLVSVLAARLTRKLVVALALLATVAVGFSRLYLGVHWMSDVLAGWALGVLWVAAIALVAPSTRRSSP